VGSGLFRSHSKPKRKVSLNLYSIDNSLNSLAFRTGLSGPFAARFALPLGPQNRGAKEHAGTGQTATVFTRHASQVYFQCDSIDSQYWRAPSWWPPSSQQLAPRCTIGYQNVSPAARAASSLPMTRRLGASTASSARGWWCEAAPSGGAGGVRRRPVALCGPVWPCVALCGPVWPCVALCGPVWPCVALCGPVWPCVALCGPVCRGRRVSALLPPAALRVGAFQPCGRPLCCTRTYLSTLGGQLEQASDHVLDRKNGLRGTDLPHSGDLGADALLSVL